MLVNQRENRPLTGGDRRDGRTFTTAQTRGAGADKRRAHPRGGGTAGDGGPAPPGLPAETGRDSPTRPSGPGPAPTPPFPGRRGVRAAAGQAPGRGEVTARPPPSPDPPTPTLRYATHPRLPPRHPPPPQARPRPTPAAGPRAEAGGAAAEAARQQRLPLPPSWAGSGPYLTGSAVMSPLPLLGAAGRAGTGLRRWTETKPLLPPSQAPPPSYRREAEGDLPPAAFFLRRLPLAPRRPQRFSNWAAPTGPVARVVHVTVPTFPAPIG